MVVDTKVVVIEDGTLQRLRYQFYILIIFTVAMCIVIHFLPNSSHSFHPPPYSSTVRYITLRSEGRRMGNLMFNYASLLGIAKRNNMTAVLPRDMALRDYFLTNMTNGDTHIMNLVLKHEEMGRRASAYDIRTESLWKQYPYEIELYGYYQSWKYFSNIEHELRTSHFVFEKWYLNKAEKFLKKKIPKLLRSDSVVRVGIHVRRSDHLLKEKVQYGYTVATREYIEQAMKYFRDRYKKLVFIVCSENHDWFEDNIGDTNDLADVIFSKEKKPAVDMAILSLCNHTIITVGSFGWWSAWLANGTTIYYNDWPMPYTQLEYQTDKKQYFPNHWIPMPPYPVVAYDP